MSRRKELFADAAALPPSSRTAFLERSCADDPALREEVERLLDALEDAGDFLETPAVAREEIARRADRVGARIGSYVIRELLGEGGMGVVWKAEQTAPVQREVALKLLRPGTESEQVLARFAAERRALERMEHANVARVFDAGSTETGRPYVVMELVRGVAVHVFCDARRLTVVDRLRLFVPVCRAVQHAHAKGIIHRDLKPSNILVTEEGGAATPKVIDFGIARAVDRPREETDYTRSLLLLGTPSYISPEQAAAGGDVDTRTDVYSLGAVLYELLCGVPPFDPRELAKLPTDQLLRRLIEDEPPKPSRRLSSPQENAVGAARGTIPAALRRLLAGDLDRIVMKAIEKDPARRYETASALADDVERFLRHEPVVATRPSAGYLALKFARRHRSGLLAALLVSASLIAGTAVSIWQAARATTNERRALASEERYRRQAYISDLNLADAALLADDPRRMKELLDAQIPEPGEIDARDAAWHLLFRYCTAPGGPIDRFDRPVLFVTISPDGETLAASGADGTIRLYETATWRRIAKFDAGQGEVNGVDFSEDGAWLASAGDDGTVKLWDTATNAERRVIRVFDQQVYEAEFAPDGLLVACGRNPSIRLFDADTGEPRGELNGHGAAVEAIALADDGRLAAATEEGIPRLWDLKNRSLIADGPEIPAAELTGVAFSPDGRFAAFGTSGSSFLLWDTRASDPPRIVPVVLHRPGEGEGVQCLAFSPAGDLLYLGDRGGAVRTIALDDGREPRLNLADARLPRWAAHTDRVYGVALAAKERQVVTAGKDGTLSVWRPYEEAAARILPFAATPEVMDYAVLPNGDVAVAGTVAIGLCDVETGDYRVLVRDDALRFHAIAASPDGRHIVVGTGTGRILAFDLREGRLKKRWETRLERDPEILHVCATPGAGFVLAMVDPEAPKPKEVQLLDGKTGRYIRSLVTPGAFNMALRPDGTMLATSRDSTVLLVDVPSLTVEAELVGHEGSVDALAFSGDGRLMASGAGDRTVTLREVATRRIVNEWVAHNGPLRSLAFSPDARLLVSTGLDLVPKLWDVSTGRLLVRFPPLPERHWPMRFLPDGGTIIGRVAYAGLHQFDGTPLPESQPQAFD